jgi:hypothetical protein
VGPVVAAGTQPAWRAAGTPEEGMTGARGCTVTAASPGGGQGWPRCGRQRRRRSYRIEVREGISRSYRRLKHRSATLARAFSPDGEKAPPRVQAAAEPVKMRESRWARRDLNPHILSDTRT